MSRPDPNDDDDIVSGINVTPLVDITLVLLIIFMVTASFMVEPSIKVDLPKAATGNANPEFFAFITINTKNELFLNGKRTTDEKIKTELDKIYRKKPDLQATINADKNVPHGQVVKILDIVRTVGITKLGISVTEE